MAFLWAHQVLGDRLQVWRKGAIMGVMPESTFTSRNDAILDARELLRANKDRTVDELVVILSRVGWHPDVARSAARVAIREMLNAPV